MKCALTLHILISSLARICDRNTASLNSPAFTEKVRLSSREKRLHGEAAGCFTR
jgi:hypothetical protein